MHVYFSQVSTLLSNLTGEYSNFVKFITTTPSWFESLVTDVSLINTQINAVRAAPPSGTCNAHREPGDCMQPWRMLWRLAKEAHHCGMRCHAALPLASASSPARVALPGAQTLFAISPTFGRSVSLGALNWIQNKPNVVTATVTTASATAQLFNVAPCLFALSQSGVNVNPILIQISPRVLQIDPLGIQIQPELFTIDPTLIQIEPLCTVWAPIHINASPSFITVAPTLKIVPGSGKPPKLSAGISIKPNPDPPIIDGAENAGNIH